MTTAFVVVSLSAAVLLTACTLAACNSAASPATPSPVPQPSASPAPSPVPVSIQLVSGWDHAPVADAEVWINDKLYTTTANGVVDAAVQADRAISVRVSGYLTRLTRARVEAITLWPVANQAEADAILGLLYDWYDIVPLRHAVPKLEIQFDENLLSQVETSTLESVWRGAEDQIADLTEGRIRFVASGDPAEGRIRISLRSCGTETICPRLPPYGFGDDPTDRRDFEISLGSPGAAQTPAVALRACILAAIEFKGGVIRSPIPGLLNGGSELSDFERRLVRMASLRSTGNRWPDSDPSVAEKAPAP